MHNRLKQISWNVVYGLAGEVDVKKWWKCRQKIINRKNVLLLPFRYIRYQRALQKCGASIPTTTKFDDRPLFPHGLYGIFISAGAKIGNNCVIFHQVTIGSNTLESSKKPGSPIIGNNCYIGTGAKIIGNVRIGNNVRIGANCIVTEDVPDNCTVVLNKPRIIQKSNVNNTWKSYLDMQ